MNTEKHYDLNAKVFFNDSSATSMVSDKHKEQLQVNSISELNSFKQSADEEQLINHNNSHNRKPKQKFERKSKKSFQSSRESIAKHGSEKTETIGSVRFAAMSYLAAREHSQKELIQKLNRRFEDQLLVEQAVQQLSDEALQCDDRFTEAFTAMRKRKGQGPIRIAFELQQKGVTSELIESYVYDTPEEQWVELAKEVCLKKYGELSNTTTLKAKQMRFLQYRGFSSDTIRQLWR